MPLIFGDQISMLSDIVHDADITRHACATINK